MSKEPEALRPQIDLDELARRESEQVEWKENVADVDDVVATLSAFANDIMNLGGGYVVCGAKEEKDQHGFPRLVRSGLSAARMREIEGKGSSDRATSRSCSSGASRSGSSQDRTRISRGILA